MTDRFRALALFVAAVLLLVGAGVHAIAGQVFVRELLESQTSTAALVGVLGAGWQLGSVSLLALSLLVLGEGRARWRGQPVSHSTLRIIMAALVAFGLGAVLLGDRRFAHVYVGYVAIGLVLAYGSGGSGEARQARLLARGVPEPAD